MSTARARKLQFLLIKELLEKGAVEILLPDGITLEIGITQENEFGKFEKSDDYCYVVATRQGKSSLLDSFNLGVQFVPEEDTIVCEDEVVDKNGVTVRTLEVV
jgi:hypothetical protein